MWVFLEHKNDANTPAVLELWVLEVGPGLGRREKELATSPELKTFIYIISNYLLLVIQNCLDPENYGI